MSRDWTIEVGRLYRTRSGKRLRVYATDGRGEYPVHCAVEYADGWDAVEYGADGTARGGLSSGDIIGEWHEPKYYPFNDDQLNECIGKRVIQKDNGRSCLIGFEVGYGLVFVFGANLNVSADNLLEYYTWPDGTPCGVLEKGGE